MKLVEIEDIIPDRVGDMWWNIKDSVVRYLVDDVDRIIWLEIRSTVYAQSNSNIRGAIYEIS